MYRTHELRTGIRTRDGAFLVALATGSVLAAISLGQAVRLRHRGVLLYGLWLVAAPVFVLGLLHPQVHGLDWGVV